MHPFKDVPKVICMFRKACKIGLEMKVREADVLLRTCAQSDELDDREDLLDRDLDGFLSHPLEAAGPQERLELREE